MAYRKQKITKPLRLLLDADVVIEAHGLGVWVALCDRAQIACPATVVHSEALFYSQDDCTVPPSIHLPSLVARGTIEMLEATVDDAAMVRSELADDVLEGLHPGESEALALLFVQKAGDYRFCTGDRAAIRALALLGLSEQGISLEEALEAVGATKPLARQFTEVYFREALREGQEHRLRGLGLRDS